MGSAQLQAQAIERDGELVLRASVPLVGTGKVGEVHVAMAGEWKGHRSGAFEFSEQVFDEMIAAFEQQKTPMLIDYEHLAPDGDTRAAGWIHGLEKRRGPDGEVQLWAKPVEWTDAAAGMIKAGEYRFCSPWFAKSSIDRVTGEKTGPRLLNVALTNLPFLDGQSPIRLSFVCAVSAAEPAPPPSAQPAAPPPSQEQAPAAPPAPQAAEQDQARAMNELLASVIDQLGKVAGVDRAAVVAALGEMPEAIDELGGHIRDHLDTDGMPQEQDMNPKDKPEDKPAAKSDDDDKAAAIEARAKEVETTLLLNRVNELTQKFEALDAERAAEKAEKVKARIDAMIADGALMEGEREDASWMCSNAPDRFERVYASRKGASKPVPIGVTQAGNEPKDAAAEQTADLEQNEIGVYHSLRRLGGYSHERAIKSIVARRNTNTARGAKAG